MDDSGLSKLHSLNPNVNFIYIWNKILTKNSLTPNNKQILIDFLKSNKLGSILRVLN